MRAFPDLNLDTLETKRGSIEFWRFLAGKDMLPEPIKRYFNEATFYDYAKVDLTEEREKSMFHIVTPSALGCRRKVKKVQNDK